jgi:hypothetical protein
VVFHKNVIGLSCSPPLAADGRPMPAAKPLALARVVRAVTTRQRLPRSIGRMPSRKTLLGLVLRAAAMAALAGIIMRLFGIA